ncbi:MAG TPA: hypothetical protein VNO31_07790 [Umezawaea sp.]|nr:hypothetical protein [Umezawaea sp.]
MTTTRAATTRLANRLAALGEHQAARELDEKTSTESGRASVVPSFNK